MRFSTSFFEYDFEFAKKIDHEIAEFRHSGVIDTKKRSLVNPHIFCVKVIGIMQGNLPMYVDRYSL
jgi:hypothetical protein